MRVAVTGGSGFIGSHVVDALVDAGHEVVVVDTAVRTLSSAASYVEADVTDAAALAAAFQGVEQVLHLAGVSNVDVAREHPLQTLRVNVEGTAAVCQAAVEVGARRVLLASTVWVYGAAPETAAEPLTEETALDPELAEHVYTASKIAAEATLWAWRRLYGLPVTVLRFGIPYGPRMRDELVLARFVNKALAGEPLTVAGDGSQYRNYVYVRDLAEAHVLALRDEAADQCFALEGDQKVSIGDMAALVAELIPGVAIERVPARPGDYRGRPVSNAKAGAVLGWRPTTTFREGVEAYLRWRQYGEQTVGANGSGPGTIAL